MTIQGANNAWSNSGTLRACDPTKVVKLQARFPQATTYTVAFNVDGARTWGPRAVVQFRTGGNTVQRIVDVSDGTAISGVCEAVNVTCYDSLDVAFVPALFAAGTPREYTISILVAQGSEDDARVAEAILWHYAGRRVAGRYAPGQIRRAPIWGEESEGQ